MEIRAKGLLPRQMSIRKTLLWFALTALTLTCAPDRPPEYAIVHFNKGTEVLDGVTVKFGGFESLCGVLIPNAEKIHDGVRTPLPETVKVAWQTPDGKTHEALIPVRGERPFRELVVTVDGRVASAVLR
jgi:hypothetical protein